MDRGDGCVCVKGEEWILIFSVCADCRRMAMLRKTNQATRGARYGARAKFRPTVFRDVSRSCAVTSLALGAVELDAGNWDAQLAGRAAFVKFLAPW